MATGKSINNNLMEITFDKQQTALFLAPVHTGYASEAQQNEVAEIATFTEDQIRIRLEGLHEVADNAETLYGTMPDGTIVEIGTAPRRPIPTA